MEPLSYEFVTKEVCKKWSDSGKADLATKFIQADLLNQRTILHELVWRCLGQYISTDDLNGWLGSTASQKTELSSVLIDVLLVIDAEVALEDSDDHKARLAKVIFKVFYHIGRGPYLMTFSDKIRLGSYSFSY